MQCEVIDHYKAPHLERYVERLVEARKKKNLTPEGARDLLHDSNYFGTVRPIRTTAHFSGIMQILQHIVAASHGRWRLEAPALRKVLGTLRLLVSLHPASRSCFQCTTYQQALGAEGCSV